MTDIDLNFLARQNEQMLSELAAIRDRLDAIQPRVDGIPLLATAVEVLQRDVRALRDDITVSFATARRHDHQIEPLLDELRAIHQWMIGIGNRVRKLEEAE